MRHGLKPKKAKWTVDNLCIAMLELMSGEQWVLRGGHWSHPDRLREWLRADGTTFGKALLKLMQQGFIHRAHYKHDKHTKYWATRRGEQFLKEYWLSKRPPEKRVMDGNKAVEKPEPRRDTKRFKHPRPEEFS